MNIQNKIYQRSPARFDMVGQFLGHDLSVVDEQITEGLAKRLVEYAIERFAENGFNITGYSVEVITLDADESPANRIYCVNFLNSKGGRLSLVGILTKRGWPTLDHGFEIATDQ